jgi:acyl-coenzyme A synthetase/AMP-(fatty) acid ligase
VMNCHVDTFVKDRYPEQSHLPELILDPHLIDLRTHINAAVALLDDTIERGHGHRTAVVADDGIWTFSQLLEDVSRASAVFQAAGVVPGNRILLRGPNNGWLVIAWLATLRAGAIAVTTHPMLRRVELDAMLSVAAPTVAVVDHRFLTEWQETSFAGATIEYGSTVHDSLEVRTRSIDHTVEPAQTAATEPAILAFTSGTTGKPKATIHSHRDILTIADTFSSHILQPTCVDVFSGSPPLAFTFGLGGLVIFPFRVGACTVLIEQASPPMLLAAVEQHGISCLFTAPTAYRAMLKSIAGTDVSSLRVCVSAGEALPASTRDAWLQATGINLTDGIGATELLHIFIAASDKGIRPGWVGKCVPGYTAQVLDDDLLPVPFGTPGRLAVKGPTGCRYLDDPRQAEYVREGWNLTGDIFIQSPDGYFQFVSRADDMIVSSGYNIAAPEVEQALLSHPAVAEVAVIGLPDDDRGRIVAAFIVLSDTCEPSDDLQEALKTHVRAAIAPYKYPRSVRFVGSLPRTATGKLQRGRIETELCPSLEAEPQRLGGRPARG